MKTSSILIVALAGLALASCTDEEPYAGSAKSQEAISFRPAIGSRATEVTNANLKTFYVSSFLGDTPYMTNVAYTQGSDGFYNSASPYYWPGDNSSLDFYAYYPSANELLQMDDVEPEGLSEAEGNGSLIFTSTEKKLENFNVPDSIKNQVDFITANGTGNKSANELAGLELTFGHRLSQIEIQAKSANKEYTYKVVGVRIGRAQYIGSFDFTTNTWELDSWHDTEVYTSSCPEVTLTETPVSIMGPDGNAMLLPQTLTPWSPSGDPDNVAREAYISVLVQITTTDTGARIYPFPTDKLKDEATGELRQYAWASIPLSGTWEAGKKYVYTLDFTNGAGYVDPDDPTPGDPVLGGPIKFTVNVSPWQVSPSDIAMPIK